MLVAIPDLFWGCNAHFTELKERQEIFV